MTAHDLPPPESLEAISRALGKIPSGLFIVTAKSLSGQTTGMLASWIQQASFDPPMLTVAVNRKRFLVDWLEHSQSMAVNLVGEGQKDLVKHFGSGFEPEDDAFAGLETITGSTGLPLLPASLAALEGPVISKMLTGDHCLFAIQVIHAILKPNFTAENPWIHLRRNGLKY